MRLFKNSQMRIGEVDIGSIKLDKSSRDDVPRLLMGLQSVYLNKVLLKKISDIMMEEMLPKVNKKDGRYGMDFWNIFVLHVVKRGASIDYDRLRDYANSHREVRGFLGLSYLVDDEIFDLQTIKNNVGLLTKEILDEISQIVSVWIKTLIFQQIFKFVTKFKLKFINKIIISPSKNLNSSKILKFDFFWTLFSLG